MQAESERKKRELLARETEKKNAALPPAKLTTADKVNELLLQHGRKVAIVAKTLVADHHNPGTFARNIVPGTIRVAMMSWVFHVIGGSSQDILVGLAQKI